jgi:hypothetical protein
MHDSQHALLRVRPSRLIVGSILVAASLWADHVIWTRQYVVSAVAGDPSAQAASTRLLKTQEDIGSAIVPRPARSSRRGDDGGTFDRIFAQAMTMADALSEVLQK